MGGHDNVRPFVFKRCTFFLIETSILKSGSIVCISIAVKTKIVATAIVAGCIVEFETDSDTPMQVGEIDRVFTLSCNRCGALSSKDDGSCLWSGRTILLNVLGFYLQSIFALWQIL